MRICDEISTSHQPLLSTTTLYEETHTSNNINTTASRTWFDSPSPDTEASVTNDIIIDDKISTTIFAALVLIFGTLANGSVVYLTKRYQQFYHPGMYIRAAYAVFDIIYAWVVLPMFIVRLFYFERESRIYCVFSDSGIAMFFSTIQLTAYIALERYFYFCHPMKYNFYFNLKSISYVCISIFCLTHTYAYATEFIFGRHFEPLFKICQLPNQTLHGIIQVAVFFLPAIICTIFSVHKIRMLLIKIDLSNPTELSSQGRHVEPRLRRMVVRRALRYMKYVILAQTIVF